MDLKSSNTLNDLVIGDYATNLSKWFLANSKAMQRVLANDIPAEFFMQAPPIETYMGLEIEIENVQMYNGAMTLFNEGIMEPTVPSTYIFKMVEDGSLRNNGWEFVSKVGLIGQQILAGVINLFGSPKVLAWDKLHASPRTSIHVHVNVLDMTVGQLRKLMLMYLILEPIFFKISGSRHNNIFCVPLVHSILPLERFFNTQNQDNFFNAIEHWTKYAALNCKPMLATGSIEFRHHCGTKEYEDIEAWMLFIDDLFNFAKEELPFHELVTLMYQHFEQGTFDQWVSNLFGITFNGHDENTKLVLSRIVDPSVIDYEPLDDHMSTSAAKKKTMKKATLVDDYASDFSASGVTPLMQGNAPQPSIHWIPPPSAQVQNQAQDVPQPFSDWIVTGTGTTINNF